MGLTKQQKHKNAIIQKQQQQLLKIQKELGCVLNKVNEAINVLKVEELQLKSSAVVFDKKSRTVAKKETKDSIQLDLKPSVSQRSMQQRSQQSTNLDLDVKHKVEEYEDDDDEL